MLKLQSSSVPPRVVTRSSLQKKQQKLFTEHRKTGGLILYLICILQPIFLFTGFSLLCFINTVENYYLQSF